MKNTKTGAQRIVAATGFSFRGLSSAYRHEAAFRQESWLAMALIPIGLWFGEHGPDKALLVGSILLLLIVELLNSALECVVDRIGEEYHDLSGRAKDMGSAAVFVAVALIASVWACVFLF